MFCKYCGTALKGDALFCSACGKRVDAASSGNAESGSHAASDVAASDGSQQQGQARQAQGEKGNFSPVCIAACILTGLSVLLFFSSPLLFIVIDLAALIVSIVGLNDAKKKGRGGRVPAIVCIIVSAVLFGIYLAICLVAGAIVAGLLL